MDTQVTTSTGETRGRGAAYLEVTNQGLLPVRIEALSWDVRGLDDVEVFLRTPGAAADGFGPEPFVDGPEPGATPFRPFDLRPGESRVVIVSGTSTCVDRPSFDGARIEARTWSGLRRTVGAGDSSLSHPSSIPC